jgi:hypothetical protein
MTSDCFAQCRSEVIRASKDLRLRRSVVVRGHLGSCAAHYLSKAIEGAMNSLRLIGHVRRFRVC